MLKMLKNLCNYNNFFSIQKKITVYPIEIIVKMLYTNINYLFLEEKIMKAIVTVTAKDAKGIIAKVSAKCFDFDANIIDISQSVVGEYFAMIMLVELEKGADFGGLVDSLNQLGKENNLIIQAMHEDIFNSMHRI